MGVGGSLGPRFIGLFSRVGGCFSPDALMVCSLPVGGSLGPMGYGVCSLPVGGSLGPMGYGVCSLV